MYAATWNVSIISAITSLKKQLPSLVEIEVQMAVVFLLFILNITKNKIIYTITD